MKSWQRYWLYLVIGYSALHLVRDISQDLGIKNFLSAPLVRLHPNFIPSWFKYNTYPVEILLITLSLLLLKKNRFGYSGYLTMIASVLILLSWSVYWFFL